jgi:hypothetical protein
VTMSASAYGLLPADARVPVLTAIVVWGLAAWSFFPAQQTRLIGLAGLKLASVVLSLNASFMFGGFALGAALGSVTVVHGSPEALGFVGAACISAALLIVLLTTRAKKLSPNALDLAIGGRHDENKQADRRLASQSFESGLPGLRLPHLVPNERSAAGTP